MMPANLSFSRIAAVWLSLLCSAVAFADGKFFALDSVLEAPTVPDQQAMIHYADGTETLAIETRFMGAGDRFAWVVPLPALPEVSAVTRGLFPTLQSLFRPRIIGDDIPDLKILFLGVTLIALVFLYRKRLKLRVLPSMILVLLILFAMLPSLARSRSLGLGVDETAVESGLTIHSRELIGDYEVSILSASDPNSLIEWLKSNGFAHDERDRRVIDDYVADGWFFAAVKLSRPLLATATSTPHPLVFKFKTATPIYPLRLTGTQDVPVSIDLYIFGPGMAVVDHSEFKTVQCGISERWPQNANVWTWRKQNEDAVALVHPQLCALVPAAPVATKLTGKLTPAAMSRDVRISWAPARTVRDRLFTRKGLRTIILNYAIGTICALSVLLVAMSRRFPGHTSRAVIAWGVLVLATASASCAAYVYLPKTDLQPPQRAASANRVIQQIVLPRDLRRSSQHPTTVARELDAMRPALEKLLREGGEHWKSLYALNNFTGRPRIEEDSPGNYRVRKTPSSVEYLWYDQDGGEHVVRLAEELERVLDTQPASVPATSPQ